MPMGMPCRVEYLQNPVTGVSVIVPCKNECDAIGQVVEQIRETLAPLDLEYEVIVVDDGSCDDTRTAALAAGARVLVHNINLGYGNSIMDGISVAQYPIIAMLDGDGTYPVHMLPRLIELAGSHDMVIGNRAWTKHNTNALGSLMRKGLYYVILYFSNTRAPDYNSGLRVFHNCNVLNYRPILCPTFSFTTSLTLLFLLTARSVLFVDIDYAKRIGTSKVSYVKDAVRTFSYVFILISLFQPYRLAILLILFGLLTNAAVLLLPLVAPVSLGGQIGLHILVTLPVLLSGISLIAYPMSKLYLDFLRRRQPDEL